ncbi:Hypothetical predicted protein [Mytilus galloprovincialis]|uniref:B box-type domain-containing protein n=1 Tax=Mytilus galloprovincialis TaxID=29158 RepID=A0A8B6H3K6_MYTGA|nr:Hypothetical predicted protein [Mytilus galloprovincialis]
MAVSESVRRGQAPVTCNLCENGTKIKWKCLNCDLLMCTKCKEKIHVKFKSAKEHTVLDIKQVGLHREVLDFSDLKCTEHSEILRRIEVQRKYLKKDVDKHTDELKGELNKKWSDFQVEEVIKVKKVVNNLQELSSSADDIIRYNDINKLFSEGAELSRAVSKADIGLSTISFLPGKMSAYIMGSLQGLSNAVHIRIIRQFQTDTTKVIFLSLCPDNSMWISDQKILQRVRPVGSKLKVISTLNLEIYDMAITPTGDLLLSSGGSVLKQISGDARDLTDSVYNVSPLYYTAIHVAKDGKVKSGGDQYTTKGRRAIIIMNQKGEHDDKNNIRIFTYPESITSTDNGNIYVVDQFSEDNGRVVVLSQHGDILQIYTGHPDTNADDKTFKPTTVVATWSNNLIVKVKSSDILDILNCCGQLITCYDVGDIGIWMPYTFSFTKNNGQLYIGCNTATGSEDNRKLHEVIISGC